MAQKLEDRISTLREAVLAATGRAVPETFQGVSKDRVREVLKAIDRDTPDMVDTVFALLDDQNESWFPSLEKTHKFCDGATTAQLACHVGILQRGRTKLDREGRDYWIKPLREVGAITEITLVDGAFVAGHPKAKSPNSAYRLNTEFRGLLSGGDDRTLAEWITGERVRTRLAMQAELANEARKSVDTHHSDLIHACVEHYAIRFLPEYETLYIDDGDGDRVTDEQKAILQAVGLELTLADSMPDVLLIHSDKQRLWIIEAVTSDGEVDSHKVAQVTRFAERNGKTMAGFTTAYQTWAAAAKRQQAHKNLAIDTYLWIQEDPAKHLRVETF